MSSRIPEPESDFDAAGLPDLGTYEGKEITGDAQGGVVVPADEPRGAAEFGTTATEEAGGEPLDQRLTREQPETAERTIDDGPNTDTPYPSDPAVRGTGRLVEPDEGARRDDEPDAVASDVGTDHGGFSAEERAMHTEPEA